ncbi:MAG: accessory gene regulator B family protein [Bacillota bacterium]|nr:accessory gene regulator B family protein [Bacillota bacterium]
MEQLVVKVVDGFIARGIIAQGDKKIYEFGLRQGISIILNLVTIIVIGIFSGELWNLTIFSVAYLWLRPYAGGYHAETDLGCYLFSTILIIMVVFVSKVVVMNFQFIVVLMFSISVMLLIAPVEDHRKLLDEMEVKIYKEKLRRRLLFELLIIMLGSYWNRSIDMIIVAIIVATLMTIFGWIKNERSMGV